MRAWILGFLVLGSSVAHAEAPKVDDAPPVANGGLDKDAIRTTVRTQLDKITYCYEKELLSNPSLAGTVMVTFFITPNGSVASASGSGVDPNVASCVANVVKAMTFPKPKGGGGVQVNYPFTFRPATNGTTGTSGTSGTADAGGEVEAKGDLDKEIIRRYVVRSIPKIQYCYEKALLAKPALAGTVKVKFFIKPDGHVDPSTGSGMDPDVATCVADVIKQIEFPKPKGGGGVEVNYPFIFKPDTHKGAIDFMGGVTATSNLAAQDIKEALLRDETKFQDCYTKLLAHSPKATGSVTLVWGIARDGKVDAATASSPEPGMCFADVIRAIKFLKPANNGIVHATWTLAYHP